MAYSPHAYIVYRGTLGGAATGADMWQFGLRWSFTGTAGGTDLSTATMTAADTRFRTAFSALGFSSAVKYEEVRGYVIGADGKALGNGRSMGTVGGTLTGSSGVSLHPWSVSMAVTLDAEGARRGRFGRIYLPPQSLTVDNTGRITTTAAGAIVGPIQALLRGVRDDTAAGEALVPVVASRIDGSLRTVKSIRVGNVPDTQRRRDNRLVELYNVASI